MTGTLGSSESRETRVPSSRPVVGHTAVPGLRQGRQASTRQRSHFGLPRRVAIFYVLAFAVAIVVYPAAWNHAPLLEPDSGTYMRAARDLSDLHLDRLQERPPGYPLLLLITGASEMPTRSLFFVSLAIHFASIWLMATILWRAGISSRLLLMFCVILLLPPYVEAAGYVLSENLASFTLALAFTGIVWWTTSEWKPALVLAAAAIAFAALTRPTFQYLSCGLAVYLAVASLLNASSLKRAAYFQAGLVLVATSVMFVGGYALINYWNFGRFTVSPIVGFALSTKTSGVFERLPDQYGEVRSALIKARNEEADNGQFRPGTTAVFKAQPELTRITGLSGAALSDYLVKLNLLLIRSAPINFLDEVAHAFAIHWFPTSNTLANFDSRLVQAVWAVANFAVIGTCGLTLLPLTGIAALCLGLRGRLRLTELPLSTARVQLLKLQLLVYGAALTIVLYTAIVSSVVGVGDPRYRTPTDGLILVMIVLAVAIWGHVVHFSRELYSAIAQRPSHSAQA
jgi:hypothetical protein